MIRFSYIDNTQHKRTFIVTKYRASVNFNEKITVFNIKRFEIKEESFKMRKTAKKV
jgi:hypothetical protein